MELKQVTQNSHNLLEVVMIDLTAVLRPAVEAGSHCSTSSLLPDPTVRLTWCLLASLLVTTRFKQWWGPVQKSQANEQWTQARILNFSWSVHDSQGIASHTDRWRVMPSPRGQTWDVTQDPKTYVHGKIMLALGRKVKKEIKQASYFGRGGQALHLSVSLLLLCPSHRRDSRTQWRARKSKVQMGSLSWATRAGWQLKAKWASNDKIFPAGIRPHNILDLHWQADSLPPRKPSLPHQEGYSQWVILNQQTVYLHEISQNI